MTDIEKKEMKKFDRERRMRMVKGAIHLAVVGLVEAFIGAATTSILSDVDCSRWSKLCAKAGGFLSGMYLGEKVADHICTSIDDTMKDIEELKKQIDEGE